MWLITKINEANHFMNGTTQSDRAANLWRTPKGDALLGRGPHTLNNLIDTFKLVLDPCCSGPDDCLIPNGRFFTPDDDGLTQDWNDNFIFNPPFSELQFNPDGTVKIHQNKDTLLLEPTYKSVIGKWIEKAIAEVCKHNVTGIGILPVYTSQTWFHQYIHNIAPIDYIHGRVHYTDPNGKTGSPNFDTMLVFWMPKK